MRILTQNYLADATTSMAGIGWSDGRPVGNIAGINLDDAAETVGASGTININLGSARKIDGIAISGHNLGDSATVTVRLTANSNYTGGDLFSMTLRDSGTADGKHYVQYMAFDDKTYRYIQIITNQPGTTIIGNIWIGQHTQITPAVRTGFTVRYESRDVRLESPTGRVMGDKGRVLRSAQLSFPKTDTETVETVRRIYDRLGTVTPLVLLYADDDGGVVPPMYCYISEFSETPRPPKSEYTLTFREGR